MPDNLMGTKVSGSQPVMVFMGSKNAQRTRKVARIINEINHMFSATNCRKKIMIMQPAFTIHQFRAITF
jgi:hypothetical protein